MPRNTNQLDTALAATENDIDTLAAVVLALKQEVFAPKETLAYVDKNGAIVTVAVSPGLAGRKC